MEVEASKDIKDFIAVFPEFSYLETSTAAEHKRVRAAIEAIVLMIRKKV